MDVNNYNEFATTWQHLVSTVKISFVSKAVSATHGFKTSYKMRTGIDFSMENAGLSIAPIAIEPMRSRCRAAAVGCYIFMPNGHVYEGIVRVDSSGTKELVHLVWFCADDAKKRPVIQLDNNLFKEAKAVVTNAKDPVPKESDVLKGG